MSSLHRDNTKVIKIGDVLVGGGNPIAIQSMTNTDTAETSDTLVSDTVTSVSEETDTPSWNEAPVDTDNTTETTTPPVVPEETTTENPWSVGGIPVI